MTKEEAEPILIALNKRVEEATTSPEKALAVLVAAGLVTADGKPTEPYRV